MRVSIFGMGYVGCTLAACLASDDHKIIAVEPNPKRREEIATGCLPFGEKELARLFKKHIQNIRVEVEPARAVVESDVTFICVGTPHCEDGEGYDLSQLLSAVEQVGDGLAHKDSGHAVVVKSTVLPHTTRDVVIPLLERCSGKRVGRDFAVMFNPEFLREGSAVTDFYAPPFTVMGGSDERAVKILCELYDWVKGPFIVTDYQTAEMVKLACNAFHALKVCFANELGNLCQAAGMDSHALMDIFVQDKRLNLSPYYLTPGFAFGGSCLPKDVGALNALADRYDMATPVLRAILPSNTDQIDMAYLAVDRLSPETVGIIGLAFKAGVSDFRESAAKRLAQKLTRGGYMVRGYDPHSLNIEENQLAEALDCDVIVVTNKAVSVDAFRSALKHGRKVIDLARALPNEPEFSSAIRIT